eukprot:jgi/Tetstr1/464980/TSEL_009711.t1
MPARLASPTPPPPLLGLLVLLGAVVAATGSNGAVELRPSSGEIAFARAAAAGRSNGVGRAGGGQRCAQTLGAPFIGYWPTAEPLPVGTRPPPVCVVDDPSGSAAAAWYGVAQEPASDGKLWVPPPLDPSTGQPTPSADFPPLPRPLAGGLLRMERGGVFDCADGGGTVFNASTALRLEKWYHKLPPLARPPQLSLSHTHGALLSLCIPYGTGFQHSMLDMLPKLSMVLPYLRQHYPGVKVLHSTGATKLLELLGVGNTLVARPGTVYTADTVLLPFFHSHTPGSIGMSAYGAADDVRGSLFPDHPLLPRLPGASSPPARGTVAASLPPCTTVLYLPRPAGASRSVKGEEALLAAVRAALRPGYKLKVFQHSQAGGLAADVAAFREARVVFGPHGGAFGNLAFMPPGGHVVEFIPMRTMWRANPAANLRPCYLYLARACRLTYWMVEPSSFDFDRRQAMRVRTEEVLAALGYAGVLRSGPEVAQRGGQREGARAGLKRRRHSRAQQASSAMAIHVPEGYQLRRPR